MPCGSVVLCRVKRRGRELTRHMPESQPASVAANRIKPPRDVPGRGVNLKVEYAYRLRSCANLREHWAVKAKRVAAERAFAFSCLCAWRAKWRERFPVCVILTRVAPRKLDSDNVASAFKAIRDGVADWLQVNDGDESKVTWRYAQERGDYAVRIEIEKA